MRLRKTLVTTPMRRYRWSDPTRFQYKTSIILLIYLVLHFRPDSIPSYMTGLIPAKKRVETESVPT